MNIRAIENLPYPVLFKSKMALEITSPVGDFYLMGSNFDGKPQKELPVFTANEFIKLRNIAKDSKEPLKLLYDVLLVKKEFGAKVV